MDLKSASGSTKVCGKSNSGPDEVDLFYPQGTASHFEQDFAPATCLARARTYLVVLLDGVDGVGQLHDGRQHTLQTLGLRCNVPEQDGFSMQIRSALPGCAWASYCS